MCLAIPMQVLRSEGLSAWCRDRDGSTVAVDTLLTGLVEPGQWLMVFLGAARSVVAADEAARVLAAIGALDAARRGDLEAIDLAFADLIEREPQLPDFLRKDLPA